MPDGRLRHAELQIGNSRVRLADESPEWGSNKSARTLSGTPVGLCIFTEDVDALATRFVKAGGKVVRELQNQFYGDRSGQFEDPEGYKWRPTQHIEDGPPDEMKRRMEKPGRAPVSMGQTSRPAVVTGVASSEMTPTARGRFSAPQLS